MTSSLRIHAHSSRDRAGVSQERAGLPEIRSRMSGCQVGRAMIGAVPALAAYLLTGWSSHGSVDTLAYRSSYPVVYTQAKEVS